MRQGRTGLHDSATLETTHQYFLFLYLLISDEINAFIRQVQPLTRSRPQMSSLQTGFPTVNFRDLPRARKGLRPRG